MLLRIQFYLSSSFVLEKLISSVWVEGSIALWKEEAMRQGEDTFKQFLIPRMRTT